MILGYFKIVNVLYHIVFYTPFSMCKICVLVLSMACPCPIQPVLGIIGWKWMLLFWREAEGDVRPLNGVVVEVHKIVVEGAYSSDGM